jgi:hypothetical protein
LQVTVESRFLEVRAILPPTASPNPALGVRVIASNKKVRRLSRDELAILGATMAAMEREGEHPTGLAAIRTMLLTGFPRLEALAMHRAGSRNATSIWIMPLSWRANRVAAEIEQLVTPKLSPIQRNAAE